MKALRIWLVIALVNLFVVAVLGTIMRYKIVYPLPWIDQRNLLHAHSHFAFAGWVSQALMTLLVQHLVKTGLPAAWKRYRNVLVVNLVAAYGMLVLFARNGYSLGAISFSILSILVSYWFAAWFWRDLNRLQAKNIAHRWFKAAILFNVISSIGPFLLAAMQILRQVDPNWYLASVYFFLHFQYNGWFLFACLGLLSLLLQQRGIASSRLQAIFFLFLFSCIPTYLLSVLWLPVAQWIYWLVVVAVVAQSTGWMLTIRTGMAIKGFAGRLFLLSMTALTIKLLLQGLSVIPSLSSLAFGFRPIVIGYLHLVLLGFVSLFIIAFGGSQGLIRMNSYTKTGLTIFTVGVLVNEALLMVQGIADLRYVSWPILNKGLLTVAAIMTIGLFTACWGQYLSFMTKRTKPLRSNAELCVK